MSKRLLRKAKMNDLLHGKSLTARVMRTSAVTVFGFGFSQAMRLLSNLVLTRMLFPEAFGLMALITTLMVGLAMFSDVGISPAIIRSKRGDDPDFLNTAFTIQIIRGMLLFGLGCVLAVPAAAFYEEEILVPMMVVASVQFIITGFTPTRSETALRHLLIGRMTILEGVSQIIALVMMLALAAWTRSVWALVIGGLIGTASSVLLFSLFLPGDRNRLRWDGEAVHELIHFGKWIFFSTALGFLFRQGDRLILGKFLSLDVFGIYAIGFFLGSFPMMLGTTVSRKLLIPVYRDRPPSESRDNFLKLRKLRVIVTLGVFSLLGVMAFFGPWLVAFLYDDRYLSAGAIVVLIACCGFPQAIGMTYDAAALAGGDSKAFFLFSFIRAALTIAGLLIGISVAGLVGALAGQFLATLAVYPSLVWLSVKFGVWDKLHDAAFALIGLLICAIALLLHWPEILMLAAG